MIKLENDKLIAEIELHGAELSRLYCKDTGREMLWNADEKYWARHAPVLFPNVGKYYNGSFMHKGRIYTEGQHGFARDRDFVCTASDEHSALFSLESDDESMKRYPFPFRLEIGYELQGNAVDVVWKVNNTGSETMYFTIGGHPAFNVPAKAGTIFTDYSLYFEGKESLDYKLLDMSSGCIIADSAVSLQLDKGKYRLRENMFDNDALVFDGAQVEKVAILYPDGSPCVSMVSKGFPNFGIWSKPGAPFVCLEPWMGRADNTGFEGELKDKPGITSLEPGKIFEISHKIIIG